MSLFKWAVWKETCDDHRGFRFPFRWPFRVLSFREQAVHTHWSQVSFKRLIWKQTWVLTIEEFDFGSKDYFESYLCGNRLCAHIESRTFICGRGSSIESRAFISEALQLYIHSITSFHLCAQPVPAQIRLEIVPAHSLEQAVRTHWITNFHFEELPSIEIIIHLRTFGSSCKLTMVDIYIYAYIYKYTYIYVYALLHTIVYVTYIRIHIHAYVFFPHDIHNTYIRTLFLMDIVALYPRTEEIVLKVITTAKISNKFSQESKYISNTLSRESPKIPTNFYMSKRSPRH